MIIASTYKPIAVFTLVGSIVIELFLFCGIMILLSAFLHHPIISIGQIQWYQLVVMLLMAVLLGWILYAAVIQHAYRIQIDPQQKTIQYKSFITQQTIQYATNSFTSYSIVTVPSKMGDYSMVLLKSNEKIVQTISGFYYSNLSELISAIQSFLPLYPSSTIAVDAASTALKSVITYRYQIRNAYGSDDPLIEFVSNTESPLFLEQLLEALLPLQFMVSEITDQWMNDEVWITVACNKGQAIFTKDIYGCVFIMATQNPTLIHAIDEVLAKHPLFEKVME